MISTCRPEPNLNTSPASFQKKSRRTLAAATPKYVGIERLRGVAILFTVLAHANFGSLYPQIPALFRESWGGVQLFFVISGFLVSESLARSLPVLEGLAWSQKWQIGKQAITAFFLRRYYRIIPPALVMVAGLLVWATALSFATQNFTIIRDYVRETLCLLGGFYNYAMGKQLTSYLGPFWSLTVEEHFYLALPFLFLLFDSTRSRIKMALVAIGIVTLGLRPISILLKSTVLPELGLRTATHLMCDFLFAGTLLSLLRAEGFASLPFVGKRILKVSAWVALAVVALAPAILPVDIVGSGLSGATFPMMLLASVFLVYLGSLPGVEILAVPGMSRILEWLGARCYSLYLVHYPILTYTDRFLMRSFSPEVLSKQFLLCALLQLSAIAIVGEIFHRTVEVRFNRIGRERSRRFMGEPISV